MILIGTYKTYSLFTEEFRLARRGTGQGDMQWEPIKEDETWQLFLQSLWQYQYVKKESPLTPEVSHTLYELTQGIPDLAFKMFRLAQMRAIGRGIEAVTPTDLRYIARDSFHVVAPMLDALRRKDIGFLMKVDDLLSIDERLVLEDMHRKLHGFPPILRTETPMHVDEDGKGAPAPPEAPQSEGATENTNAAEAPKEGEDPPAQEGKVATPETPQPPKTKESPKEPVEVGVWAAVLQARKKKISAHQVVAEAGYAGHYYELPEILKPASLS